MNILETFYFMFDSDAKKLDKGLADSTKSADKLEKELQKTDKAAGMVGGAFLDLAGKAAFALGAIFSIGAIKSSILEVSNFADSLNDSAKALGVNVSALHAWDNAAQMSGGQTGAFTASLATFNTGLNAIATKGTGLLLPFLQELGLSMADIKAGAKDPIGALEKMSDAFSKLSASEAAGLGSKLGLDQGTVNLLREGRTGLDELIRKQKELGVMTEEQAEVFEKFNDELDATSYVWQDLKRKLVTLVIPALTWFLRTAQSVTAWAKENKTVVAIFFTVLTAAVLAYGQAALVANSKAWLFYARIIATIGAILLFGAALALVTEDLYTFQKGGDSVVGDWAKKWPIIGTIIKGIGLGLTYLIASLGIVGKLIVDTFEVGPLDAFTLHLDEILGLVADMRTQWPALDSAMTKASLNLEKIVNRLLDGWENLKEIIDTVIASISKAVDLGAQLPGSIGGVLSLGKSLIGATNSPISSQTSNSISNSGRTSNKTTTFRVDKINVKTQATDAEGISKGIRFGLSKEVSNLIDGFDDGVAA